MPSSWRGSRCPAAAALASTSARSSPSPDFRRAAGAVQVEPPGTRPELARGQHAGEPSTALPQHRVGQPGELDLGGPLLLGSNRAWMVTRKAPAPSRQALSTRTVFIAVRTDGARPGCGGDATLRDLPEQATL